MSDQAAGSRRKRGRPTAAERDERREQILDAAVDLFAANGYGRVTVDEIALRARVTKRTIYAYLGDKAEVFAAVIERFRLRAVHELTQVGDSLEDAAAAIVHVLHADDAVAMHRLMIGECRQFPELASRFYESGPRGYVELLERHLDAAPPADAPVLAEALFGLLLGEPHRRRLLGLTPAPSTHDAAEHASTALRLLGLGGSSAGRSHGG